jgi:hypothetical protein
VKEHAENAKKRLNDTLRMCRALAADTCKRWERSKPVALKRK